MRKANPTSGRKTAKAKNRAALSAQQTIPYVAMHPDGVCKLPGGLYTKTVEYEDINYSVASTEDQTAIFGGWSSFLNYFDSSLPFQLSFINRRSHSRSRYKVNIPQADDDFNSVREEFTGMLKNQIARSNNGIERSKYITFGIPAGGIVEARPRLERVEADVMGNFKRLGVPCEPMDGRARLALLHSQMHPGNREPFRFSWKDIPQTGLGTKDYIAPDSFDFRHSRLFRVGQYWGAVSYLQILASELSDKLLAEILELDAEMTVTLHIQTVDQLKAIKTIKGKISDIGKMKVEEQRKGRVDPMYHEKIDGLIDRYARKLAENINQSNLIDARVPSILIAGGSNFPVRKKEKQNAARDKNMGEYMQIEGLLDKVRSTGMGGISADDDRAVEKLEAKLAGLEAMQEEMKTVNAYYRKHKTLEGCPVLSAEEIGKLQSSMASDWRKNPVPYPSYLLTNNNANIRRTRQRIEDLKSQSEYSGWAFPGGRAEINEGENRLQLFFEEKPSEEQRRELKSNGFKWAPSQGAWQRQLTKNAIYAAGRMEFLRPEDGQSPYQLQPFARKTEKDMTR